MIGDGMELAALFCCDRGFLDRCCRVECDFVSVCVCVFRNNLRSSFFSFLFLFPAFMCLFVQETKIDCVRVATKGRNEIGLCE